MKTITLTQGLLALVSTEDFEYLNQWVWHANATGNGGLYVKRSVWAGGLNYTIRMHNLVAERIGLVGIPDHKDRDGLNNQRDNLRAATHSQNMANHNIQKNTKSGYKGVSWRTQTQRWRATIKGITLGEFDCPIKAAKAYNNAALRLFGEFAFLNLIPEE